MVTNGKRLKRWQREALTLAYFVPGRVVEGYARQRDLVLAYEVGGDVPGWMAFRVTVRGEDGRVRQHCTRPSDDRLLAAVVA